MDNTGSIFDTVLAALGRALAVASGGTPGTAPPVDPLRLLAAGTCVDTEVHTLTEAPLAALNQLLADPGDFAAGSGPLPADQVTGPDRKPLHHDPAEFLKNQLHLGYFQARYRIDTNERLMDHHGPDGTTLPPTCPQLAGVLAEDVGDVEPGTCGCGRTSQVINFRGRGQGGGLGHCPVSIECYLGSGTTAHDEAAALVKA